MLRIQYQSHFTHTSFQCNVVGQKKPYTFTKDQIPGFTPSTVNVFNEILQQQYEFFHPGAIADRALSKNSWSQVIPAAAESLLKVGTAGAIIVAGYSGNCYLTQECDPYSPPAVVTHNQDAFALGLAAGIGCGTLSELWSNVRNRWKEGKTALNELTLALSEQSRFITHNYRTLKNEIKEELKEILLPAPSSPSKSSPRKVKPKENPRKDVLVLALDELRRARYFDQKLKGITNSILEDSEAEKLDTSSSKTTVNLTSNQPKSESQEHKSKTPDNASESS